MNKKELIRILSQVFIPSGFRKKGNYWVMTGEEITKMINLQKSKYGNFYYINYGYNINSIPLDKGMMHIYNRVTSFNAEERDRITFLLNLDSSVSDEQREYELKQILERLISNIQSVNSEDSLLNELKNRSHLNDIPLVVKKHFNI